MNNRYKREDSRCISQLEGRLSRDALPLSLAFSGCDQRSDTERFRPGSTVDAFRRYRPVPAALVPVSV